MRLDPTPIPTELAAPDEDADQWVYELAHEAARVAEQDGLDVTEAVALLLRHSGDTLAPLTTARAVERLANPTRAPAEARAWTVTDDGAAEWAMRHVADAEREIGELRAQADEWTARIEDWFARKTRSAEARRAFMSAHLEAYALTLRAESGGKVKTVILPSGRVSTRGGGPRVVVYDEEAVLAWADRHHPNIVQRKVLVTDLRTVAKPVEMLIAAKVTHSPCGCVASLADMEGLTIPAVGTAVECPECGAEALLARVDPTETVLVAVDSVNGGGVPGAAVEQPDVTVSVHAERP